MKTRVPAWPVVFRDWEFEIFGARVEGLGIRD